MWHLLISLALGQGSGSDFPEIEQHDEVAQPFQIGVQPDYFLAVGGIGGISLSSVNGSFVGIETSLSRVHGNRLLGLSGDIVWDNSLNGVTATIGPRMGMLVFAMDGGISIRSQLSTPAEIGGQLRFLLNLGVGTVYYRTGFWPIPDELSTVHQIGFGIRFPQRLGYNTHGNQESFTGRSQ